MALDEFVKSLIKDGTAFASVATVMPDGSPQVSLMWVDADDDYILVNSAEGRVKTDNMRREPRVALAIINPENPYRQAMVRGRIVDVTQEGAFEHTDTLAKKYLGMDKYPYHQEGDVRVIFKIKPESVTKVEA